MSGARFKRGFTLLELIVAGAIFLLISLLCVHVVSYGFSLFGQTNSRHVLQRDARAIFGWLKRDAGISNFNLAQVDFTRTSPTGEPRHALGLPGLASWSPPVNTHPTGQPRWDRFVVYLCTRDEGSGQLLRQSAPVAATPGPLTRAAAEDLLGSLLLGTTEADDQRRLSSSVRSFLCRLDIQDDLLEVEMVLQVETVRGGTGQKTSDILETHTAIHPRNTWPRN